MKTVNDLEINSLFDQDMEQRMKLHRINDAGNLSREAFEFIQNLVDSADQWVKANDDSEED